MHKGKKEWLLKYHVIFRVCDAVYSIRKTQRPFGLSKKELIKKCFLSLKKAIDKYPHFFYVIGDNLSEEMIEFFKGFEHLDLQLGIYGNDESIRQTIKYALTIPKGNWVYFCEDDYLHVPHAFDYIQDFIDHREEILSYRLRTDNLGYLLYRSLKKRPLFIHPPDYPDRYQSHKKRPSFIFHSNYCHWRQITNTTFTFMTEADTLRKYRNLFLKVSHKANDFLLSKKVFGRLYLYNRALCVCPLPGLSTHLHEKTMTPLVDWKKILDAV